MLFSNIAETLAINARRRPDHPAIISAQGAIDYATFARRCGQTASMLADHGVGPRDIVGIALKDTAEHLVAMYACAWLGATVLPFDWRWSDGEKENLAGWFRPRLILAEPDASAIGGHEMLHVDAAWLARRDGAPPDARAIVRDEELGLILSLSSGTTGRPKGPLLTHRLAQNRFLQHWAALSFHEQDRHLISTPLYFGGGRMFALSHLFIGATVILLQLPYTPEQLIESVRRHRVSTMFIVPTMLRRLLSMPAQERPLLDGPRYVISGGSALHPSERAAALKQISPNLVNYYSSSEGGAVSILLPSHRDAAEASVGRPVFLTDVEIVDGDDRPVEIGQIGLVRYRGPGVPSELYMDPQESRFMFRAGWFYPGDMGRMDASGFLYLTGRAKDMIIRGGVNIYPQDIERTIMRMAAVEDVAVVGWPSAAFGEEIAAFVVARPELDAASVIAFCRAELATYKAPRDVFFVDSLPKNSAGKVLKKDLAARLTRLD
ncbi:MAG: AMP-binding protein [Methylobacteriaceae bacterium]|nr:AMP-binding protein [Methylobacteriaceae bacterium]